MLSIKASFEQLIVCSLIPWFVVSSDVLLLEAKMCQKVWCFIDEK